MLLHKVGMFTWIGTRVENRIAKGGRNIVCVCVCVWEENSGCTMRYIQRYWVQSKASIYIYDYTFRRKPLTISMLIFKSHEISYFPHFCQWIVLFIKIYEHLNFFCYQKNGLCNLIFNIFYLYSVEWIYILECWKL